VRLSYYSAGQAAAKLEGPHPLPAAKLPVAMAVRILVSRSSKKSRYSDAALGSLETARKLLRKEGRAGEWEALASEIRRNHRRKTGFVSGFERLAEGWPLRGPSFAARARARWSRGAFGGRGAS